MDFAIFQHIPGKSFRLVKFLMYVWNTFRGHIKLQKTLQLDSMERSNIDIMIHADEQKIIWKIFLLFGLCHFSAYSREKFLVKIFEVGLKHI